VSFEITQGEVVGFLGPNGAGKTTTMKIVTGFMPATSGSVSVCGFDVNDKPVAVRKLLGYLPENAPLYTDLNVWEYLSFMAEMHDVPHDKRIKRLKEVVEVCGLKDKMRSEIQELSKGYKQRVGLAGTLIHDPEVLILDEPTNGLDPNQIIEIRGLIKEIGHKKTVILSSHILSEVEVTCSRVIIINRGEIVAQGTPQELRDLSQGANRIHLQVEGSLHAVTGVIQAVPGVLGVAKEDGHSAAPHVINLVVDVEKGNDVRKEVGMALYKTGHPLLELKREEVSLENVFTQLTS